MDTELHREAKKLPVQAGAAPAADMAVVSGRAFGLDICTGLLGGCSAELFCRAGKVPVNISVPTSKPEERLVLQVSRTVFRQRRFSASSASGMRLSSSALPMALTQGEFHKLDSTSRTGEPEANEDLPYRWST